MLSFVNRITTLLHAAGRLTGPVLDILAVLLKRAAKKVLTGDGLKDMAPGSAPLQQLNAAWDFNRPDTYFVGSDFTPDSKFKRLIDAKLIDAQVMQQANDGVIPTQGTLGLRDSQPYREGDPYRYLVPKAAHCGHFMYYAQDEVVEHLIKHLS